MKTFALTVALLLSCFGASALPACICTTNLIHVVIHQGGSGGAWSIPSYPGPVIAEYWLWRTSCVCSADMVMLNPPRPPAGPVGPTSTNPAPNIQLVNSLAIPNNGMASILPSQIMDEYAASNGVANPYYQTLSSFAVETSTDLVQWSTCLTFTNWHGLGTMKTAAYLDGSPLLTNSVSSQTKQFQTTMDLSCNLPGMRRFFRLRAP